MHILIGLGTAVLVYLALRRTLLSDGFYFKTEEKPSAFIKIPEQEALIPFREGHWYKNPISSLKVLISLIIAVLIGALAAVLTFPLFA